MFSYLVDIPFVESIRRRRLTLAAKELNIMIELLIWHWNEHGIREQFETE